MEIRFEFARGREVMFLSHLDLMRAFGRAIRRSGIPIRYSEGFNPHAEMVFGLPLQVGVTGAAECLDIALAAAPDASPEDAAPGADEAAARLNAQLPPGLAVTRAREKTAKAIILELITHAAYELRVGFANPADSADPSDPLFTDPPNAVAPLADSHPAAVLPAGFPIVVPPPSPLADA
ncbi:MAG: TIGR03936 family radical SAM-associated protein, partial [Clostridiales bacterium]|nr:TIGR03936 family radical SAM-associated protein [Clostridiales bacterium]